MDWLDNYNPFKSKRGYLIGFSVFTKNSGNTVLKKDKKDEIKLFVRFDSKDVLASLKLEDFAYIAKTYRQDLNNIWSVGLSRKVNPNTVMTNR